MLKDDSRLFVALSAALILATGAYLIHGVSENVRAENGNAPHVGNPTQPSLASLPGRR
ncbi:MAG: hypothetical protein ABL931_11415 [Usitatibacteraceae bacterium]